MEYIDKQRSEKAKEETFAPQIFRKSKALCKSRQTLAADEEGKTKVKPVLFSALYFDAEE